MLVMDGNIPHVIPPIALQICLYEKLCKMFEVEMNLRPYQTRPQRITIDYDIENLMWYKEMVEKARNHFQCNIIELPVHWKASPNVVQEIKESLVHLAPIKVAIFEIEEIERHPLKWNLSFKGFKEL